MSDIAELMASNDPMATPVMSLGPAPPPPMNTSPPPGVNNTATMHDKQIEQMSPLMGVLPDSSKSKPSKTRLKPDQKTAIVVAICTFLVLLPNVQQLLTQQLPVLTTNNTLHLVTNSILVAFVFMYMKDHIGELL
tara:strand:- start:665 stop:1069 length:405 start_codon:yes stop_codon:yes gene_type:complete